MDEYRYGVRWAHPFPLRLESPGVEFSLVDVACGLPGTSLSTWCDGSERQSLDIDSFGKVEHLLRTHLRAETVLMHDEEKLLRQWDLFIDQPDSNYRVFPNGNLLIFPNQHRYERDRPHNVVIIDPAGEIVSAGTLSRNVRDVQISAGGNLWVTFGELGPIVNDELDGIAKYSPNFDLLWAPDDDIEASSLAVLGESALIWDDASWIARMLPDGPFVGPDLSGSVEAVMYQPDDRRWGFVQGNPYGSVTVTLGWSGYHGEWKPYAQSVVALPPASRFEKPIVRCEADAMHVWVGNRWYIVTLDALFEDTFRTVAPKLPVVGNDA
jgi:hypothetical protein